MKKALKVAFSVIFIDHIGLSITLPMMTLIFFSAQSRLFDANTHNSIRAFYYGMCNSLPFFIGVVLVPILSILSDRWGRKALLVICTLGTAVFLLGGAVGIIYGSILVVILSRAFTGVFARVNPIGQAIVGDLEIKNKKAVQMGNLQVVLSVAAILGPLIGGCFAVGFWFKQLNFALPYLIATVLALLSMVIAIYYFKETNQSLKDKHPSYTRTFIDTLKLFKKPTILHIAFITFLFQFTWSIYFQFSAPVAKVYLGFGAKEIGLFISAISLWLALGAFFGVKIFCKFFSEQKAVYYSNYLIILGFLITFIAFFMKDHHLGSLFFWMGAAPTALGDIIAYSCISALFSDAVNHKDQGKVMGVCFIVASLAWGIGAFVGGLLGAISCELPLLIAPLGSLIFLFYALLSKNNALNLIKK